MKSIKPVNHTFSVAPMLDWTDRHCRYFYRVMSQHAVLYTEMVTTGAILFGKGDYIKFDDAEHPVVLQLGGSDASDMTKSAIKAQEYGYDEININVGCPSDRVQNGMFGACLMAKPELVADCVKAMQAEVDIPVTVKTRIGIDDSDDYAFLQSFVEQVADAGCEHFIVHARKAWLQGLSPKQNREVPPLNYPRVYQLKQEFPELQISINGGIETFEQVDEHLQHIDGVMLGRAVYQNPYMLAELDAKLFSCEQPILSRRQVVEAMYPYIERETAVSDTGYQTTAWHIARHMLGLFNGQPNARMWRRYLSENARNYPHGIEVFEGAFAAMEG
ncbi:tRNA dihydrouridine(20/20a) synthase DusA [Catenovulum agarivorans]|uniref:tRNA dihydrouridine(20/20a) synthase DusA n=1 Tax=Catenovulum agarivorans TaxID=1172192 RepID=UPI00058F0DDA|nr:tRNA dihydrouridine(20/20a) synthase DusA [Catenovulum agarivorans]